MPKAWTKEIRRSLKVISPTYKKRNSFCIIKNRRNIEGKEGRRPLVDEERVIGYMEGYDSDRSGIEGSLSYNSSFI